MATTKTSPELYPLTIDGTLQWVKRGQYTKQIAEQQTIKLSAEIKKAHVEEMLDACEKGITELNAEAPDEMKKTFDRVRSDYDDAKNHVKELEEEEARKKQEEADAIKAKADAEEKLFLEVKEDSADFGTMSKLFDTGENMDRFVPKGNVNDRQLLTAFASSLKMGEFTNWMRGDLVVALEDRGQLGVVAKLCEATGQPYANIYNAAKTARNVPPEKRTKGVSYTIYAEIANAKYSDKPEDHKAKMIELVDKAAAGEIKNSQDARAIKMAASGKTAPKAKLPEEDEKAEFIVIDHENSKVEVTVGFPKELFANGAIILNKRTGKQFTSFKAKPENRWTDLSIYKKPEPAPAAKTPAKKGK